MKMRVHAMLGPSYVNGPGARMVLWTQGCPHACKGCFNPETWAMRGGKLVEIAELVGIVERAARAGEIEGLTITGGEPVEQIFEIREFLTQLSRLDIHTILPKGVVLFTGYTMAEIQRFEGERRHAAMDMLKMVDVVIDGRFVEGEKQETGLAGSANQQFWYSSAPGRGKDLLGEDLITVDQEVEIHVSSSADLNDDSSDSNDSNAPHRTENAQNAQNGHDDAHDVSDVFEITGFPAIDRATLKAKGITIEKQ